MKLHSVLAFSLALCIPAFAEDAHDHDDHAGHDHDAQVAAPVEATDDHAGHDHGDHAEKVAGPNGGRVLTGVEPHLEFVVTDDNRVMISALDNGGKVVPVSTQSVTLYTGDRSNPTRLSFTLQDGALVSDGMIPDGDSLPVVVRIKKSPDSPTITERFNLNLSLCPGCSYKEYACTCDDH